MTVGSEKQTLVFLLPKTIIIFGYYGSFRGTTKNIQLKGKTVLVSGY